MLRKLVLLAVSVIVFGCKGDNDDIIEPNDVSNIDLSEGIVFGFINPEDLSQNVVYRYKDDGIFLVDLTEVGTITSETEWETVECPYAEGSLTDEFTADVPNVARGIRDIQSTDIAATIELGEPFYILEYVTSGNKKTIQFNDKQSFTEEQISTYFSYIRTNLVLIGSASGDSPLDECE